MIDNEYIMSPKDLCTIDILDKIIDSGVEILKIEGRGKGPEYVYTVTKIYNEALKAIEENNYTKEKIEQWKIALEKVYNRGFWEGYYLGRKLGEWTENPGSAATEKKVYVGKGKKYFSKAKIGEFVVETGTIKIGDSLMITSPDSGIHTKNIERLVVNGVDATVAVKGDSITIPIERKITSRDKLYKIVEA